ncbi:hypothetical protein ACN47E_001066 [Coniothyrium glycines]
MRKKLLLVVSLAGVVLAGLAGRNCGQTKSFSTTNHCGVGFGGEWVHCKDGLAAIPTFTMPPCGPTPHALVARCAANVTSMEEVAMNTTAVPTPIITPPPWINATATNKDDFNSTSSTCSPLWICIDALAVCGGVSRMYGNCHDTCTPVPLVPPVCNLPTATAAPAYDRAHPKMVFGHKPPATPKVDHCNFPGREWMCRPKDW